MISSGLTIQKRGQFENGFPSTRERVRITERPNDQAANFNTSQYYPESIPLPGQVMPSQIRYHQIFGKSTTPDERNYFLTYGIAQNTLAKANATMRTQRAPKRERLGRQDMEMLEGAADEYMTVRHHLDPVDQTRAMEGVRADFGAPRGSRAPSESTQGAASSVVSGSRDASMAATARDEDMVANTVLADVNDVLPNLMLSPTEDDHIQARTFGLGPPPPPPAQPVVGLSRSTPQLSAIETYLSSGGRKKGKQQSSSIDDVTAEIKKGVTLRKSLTNVYSPTPSLLQDELTTFLAKRKSESSGTSKMSE